MEADWWMVWITVASVGVSGVLAWLAYRNGRKATEIAAAAAARDEGHRQREVEKIAADERSAVARAMMRAVNATEQATSLSARLRITEELDQELARRSFEAEVEALTEIDLYATHPDDEELHVWFEASLAALSKIRFSELDHMSAIGLVYDFRRGIRLWNARKVTSGKLAVGELPSEELGLDQ